jgi:hypothetical protein
VYIGWVELAVETVIVHRLLSDGEVRLPQIEQRQVSVELIGESTQRWEMAPVRIQIPTQLSGEVQKARQVKLTVRSTFASDVHLVGTNQSRLRHWFGANPNPSQSVSQSTQSTQSPSYYPGGLVEVHKSQQPQIIIIHRVCKY